MHINERPIVLVTPPPADPTQPYTSLPALSAFLKHKGYQVLQKDIGLELFDEILTPKWLLKSCEAASARFNTELRMDSTRQDSAYHDHYLKFSGIANYLIKNVTLAKNLMRSQTDFYDLKRYQWSTNILHLCFMLASLSFYPTNITPSNYFTSAEFSLEGLLRESENKINNFYHSIFENKVVPELLSLDPLLIGISITYKFQIISGFTLARLLKKSDPKVHISLGGAIVTRMDSHLISDPGFFEFADSYVIGEGETALSLLASNVSKGIPPQEIPNCILSRNGYPHTAGLGFLEDVNQLPCPEFDDLQLERYFSPEPVLLVSSARGCYHGKCSFCDVSRNTRSKYRPLKKGLLINNIQHLHRRYGANKFFFTDDAMPPSHMKTIAKLVADHFGDVTWQAEARFEKIFSHNFIGDLKAGGCRQLIFGFESACQRIIDIMQKHNNFEINKNILESCYRHGIAVNLQTIIGFPTETKEEASQTIEFLLENEDRIASIGFASFSLYEETPVYKHPSHFGIDGICHTLTDKLLSPCFYEPLLGMSIEDIKNFHADGMRRLLQTYGTRSRYLAGAAGAHSLIHFSRFLYDDIYKTWKSLDNDNLEIKYSIDEILPVMAPKVLYFSHKNQSGDHEATAFCTEKGIYYELSSDEKAIINLCDGQRTVGDISSAWAVTKGGNLYEEIILLSRSMAILHELLKNGLIVATES